MGLDAARSPEPSFEDEEKKSGHIKSSKAVAAKTSPKFSAT